MITAILEAGILKGKIRMINALPEIDILLPIMLKVNYGELSDTVLDTTPRARFVWNKQIKKFTHLYRLKEIL